jgi:hypothetical protein
MNMLGIFSKNITNKNFAIKGSLPINNFSFSKFCTDINKPKTKSIYKKNTTTQSSSINQNNSVDYTQTNPTQNIQKEREGASKKIFNNKEPSRRNTKENFSNDLFTENLQKGMDEYLNKMVIKFFYKIKII